MPPKPQKITRQYLEDKYGTEEACGIHQQDYSTGERVEYEDITDDMSTITMLPNDASLAICTYGAQYVIKDLGEGDLYGFFVKDNPVEDSEITGSEGHDFAVIRGRYIVDLWIKHFVQTEDKAIFDLQDPEDAAKITELYGDPRKWTLSLDSNSFEPGDPAYPHSKRMVSYAQRQELALAM